MTRLSELHAERAAHDATRAERDTLLHALNRLVAHDQMGTRRILATVRGLPSIDQRSTLPPAA